MTRRPGEHDARLTGVSDEAQKAVARIERATHGIRLRGVRATFMGAWAMPLSDDVARPSGLLRHLRDAA
jgi:hypothetical protein